jgi:SAM-dependent methyltransferase
MLEDRYKWNRRYQKEEYPLDPSAIVKEYARLARGRKALDIAAGNGRNSLFLAEQGFAVDAVDIADVGLALFSEKHPDIHPICADLDHYHIVAHTYDLIINIKFLNRSLLPQIKAGLAPGGVLIFQTFVDKTRPDQMPPNQVDYYLRPNELLHSFLSLNILLYREARTKTDNESTWMASLVAVKNR